MCNDDCFTFTDRQKKCIVSVDAMEDDERNKLKVNKDKLKFMIKYNSYYKYVRCVLYYLLFFQKIFL